MSGQNPKKSQLVYKNNPKIMLRGGLKRMICSVKFSAKRYFMVHLHLKLINQRLQFPCLDNYGFTT